MSPNGKKALFRLGVAVLALAFVAVSANLLILKHTGEQYLLDTLVSEGQQLVTYEQILNDARLSDREKLDRLQAINNAYRSLSAEIIERDFRRFGREMPDVLDLLAETAGTDGQGTVRAVDN